MRPRHTAHTMNGQAGPLKPVSVRVPVHQLDAIAAALGADIPDIHTRSDVIQDALWLWLYEHEHSLPKV